MPLLVPNERQRQKLKQPLGQLIVGTPAECNQKLNKLILAERPPRLLLIGDTVSRNAVQAGIMPDIMVIDQKEMRGEAVPFAHTAKHIYRTTNPAGTIDLGAWKTIEEATVKGNSIVYVDGEEDLLTLVALIVAPLGSVVVYGQPEQGIVIVRVSSEKKKEIDDMIKHMEKRE